MEVVIIITALLMVFGVAVRSETLIWSDEFNGPIGSAPDPQKWIYDIGGSGWGNNELEYYTDRRDNSAQDGTGNLRITAVKDGGSYSNCWYGQCQYTSARLLTSGRFSTKYGRIEARIKLPYGKGVWPAFWMLGTNIKDVGWPTCGELDIMEMRGSVPGTVSGALHAPGYSGGQALSGAYTLPDGRWLRDDFHVFGVSWTSNLISLSIDNHTYKTFTPSDIPAGSTWAFDHEFFILLNFAVGGNFDGAPSDTTPFPQSMIVDYVRVYSA